MSERRDFWRPKTLGWTSGPTPLVNLSMPPRPLRRRFYLSDDHSHSRRQRSLSPLLPTYHPSIRRVIHLTNAHRRPAAAAHAILRRLRVSVSSVWYLLFGRCFEGMKQPKRGMLVA